MQRLVSSIYRSRSFKIVSKSITMRVSSAAFLVLENIGTVDVSILTGICVKKHIYSQLYCTKRLNECKFQNKQC